MPRRKKTPAPEALTPMQEIDRKIRYHEDCIEKLKARRAKLSQPSRKQLSTLLARVEGMTMEEIAEKLGVTL
jgi:hypothetical protein